MTCPALLRLLLGFRIAVHLQSFSRACHLEILCLPFAQFNLNLKVVFLKAFLIFRMERRAKNPLACQDLISVSH